MSSAISSRAVSDSLRADADAVDAATAIDPETARIHRAGVRFQRDFHAFIEAEQPGGFVEYGADAGSLEGRRGAAAEKDRFTERLAQASDSE